MAEGAAAAGSAAPAAPTSSAPSGAPAAASPDAAFGPPPSGLPGVIPDSESPSLPSSDGADARQSDVPEVEAAKPPRFKFAGEEFDSQEAAEQNFRSLRGQYKPLQALGKQLGGMDRIPSTLSEAALSAREWKAAHDRVSAELASIRAGQPAQQQSSQPQSPTPVEQAAAESDADVDWDLYAEIKSLATESGKPWEAERWLINQVREQERKRVESLMDDKLMPFHEARARAEVVSQTDRLFSSLAEQQLADGSVAFPELRDEEQAFEVGKIWASMGLDPQAALTPAGAIAAIALYRMFGGSASQDGAAVSDASQVAQAAPQPTQAQVAAGLDGGRPTPTAPTEAVGISAEAARLKAALRQAHNITGRGHLGFSQ